MPEQLAHPPAFELSPEDVRPDLSTREARIKWVMVIAGDLGPGLVANTASCLAAAVGKEIPGIIGAAAVDASGSGHPGLPWTGCTILTGDTATIRRIRDRSLTKSGLLVVDMPELAQVCRVYAGYLDSLAARDSEDIKYHGVSLVGPRNKVDKIVGRLPLLA